jgi:hypothetical protein
MILSILHRLSSLIYSSYTFLKSVIKKCNQSVIHVNICKLINYIGFVT